MFQRSRRACVAVLTGLVAAPAVLGGVQSPPFFAASPFGSVVEIYRSGRTDEAVTELGRLVAEDLQLGPAGPRATGQPRDPTVQQARAAAMLHADAVGAVWSEDRPLAWRHFEAGRRWADLTATYLGEKPDASFRRRWYLAAGLLLVERGAYEGGISNALAHFDQACREFPDDVALLTATAWLEERVALTPAPVTSQTDVALLPRGQRVWLGNSAVNAVREKGTYLQRAAGRVSAALKTDLAAAEPALRLGRLRRLLGDNAAARQQLQPLVDRQDLERDEAYLARVFLARVLQRGGETKPAADLYRQAIARVPGAQAARMGLAHLLYQRGDFAAAAAALHPSPAASSQGGAAAAPDPWIEYLVGHMDRGPELRAKLRGEVQR